LTRRTLPQQWARFRSPSKLVIPLKKEQHRGSQQSAATLESLARPPLIHNLASALASITSAAAEYFDRVEGPGTKGT
jgi:hypothetical protein